MAIADFIPTVWSETLYKELEGEYIAVKNCNRDFEGEIRGKGDTVKICGIDPITVFSYSKNTDFTSTLQTLDSNTRSLVIDTAKAFNFQIDDIDRAQANPKLMRFAMREAASALAAEADKKVFGLYSLVSADQTITKTAVTTSGMVDILLAAREKLYAGNVNSSSDIVLEVSPAVASRILKAKIINQSDNSDCLEKGYIGTFLGFKIYVSNNVCSATSAYKCLARTTRAIAFAEQINSVEAYRPEKRFADAVKGLHLYGAKIIYPEELVLLDLTLAATDA